MFRFLKPFGGREFIMFLDDFSALQICPQRWSHIAPTLHPSNRGKDTVQDAKQHSCYHKPNRAGTLPANIIIETAPHHPGHTFPADDEYQHRQRPHYHGVLNPTLPTDPFGWITA